MAQWQDFTAYVDQYLGQLTPEGLQVVREAQRSGGNTALRRKAADVLAVQLGWDAKKASNFVVLAENVLKRGGKNVQDSRDMAGNVHWSGEPARLPDRSAFGSDEQYFNAVLGMFGLDAAAGGGTTEDPDAAAKADITTQMQAFVDSLLGPVPDNDPTAIAISQQAANAAQAYAGRAGVNARSTIGAGATSAQTARGLAAYDFERQKLAGQGLQMLSNRDLGLGQLQAGYEQLQIGLADAKFAGQQNQAQAMGALTGGLVGGVVGGYAGGPTGAATGMQAGSSAGAGLFGMFSGGGGPNYRSINKPSRGINPYTGR